ncbi:MAG: glycoside hydrolase family 28 protein, partial [Alistipes sp.]|nr:glycoside hydrolase family 28 protein [Alistipes sp.]
GKSAVEVLESGSEERAAEAVPPVDETTPAFRRIDIRRLNCLGARRAIFFNGIPEMPIEGIRISDTRIRAARGGEIRHACRIVLDNVEIDAAEGPALTVAHCDEINLQGFAGEVVRQTP